MEISCLRTVTVLNEKGNQHTNTFVGYNNAIKVKNISAEIYDKTGAIVKKVRKKDFLDVSAVDGGTLYSDSRVLYTGYLPVDYPYTVKFTYELETANTGNIPSWNFLDGFLVSTERTEYKVEFADATLKPMILEKNFGDYPIISNETFNSVSYQGENIQAIKDENLRPSLDKVLPQLMVSPVNFYYEGYNGNVSSWKEAGAWMNDNLLTNQDELSSATVSTIKNLVSGVEDSLEKAKIIYQYVQENTRYISVQVGIGGLKPISAIEVDRLKYGDCKGLANYTKALLKTVEVESYYVHVEAGQDKVDFEEEVPSFGQGNHVILAIPYNEKYYWIDCTSQVHPFGFLGDFTDDRKVLLMKPEGGEIATTDAYLDEDNEQIIKASYVLDEEGSFSGNINIQTKGIKYDEHFYLENLPKLDVEKQYKNYWSNINNLEVEEFTFQNDKNNIVFEENLRVNARKYGAKSNNRLIFVANSFNNSQYIPRRNRNRKFSMEIPRGFLDRDEFEILIPENYSIESLPQDSTLETKFGEYSIHFKVEGGKIKLNRKLFVKSGTYPSSDYDSYRVFWRNIAKLDNSKIVIIQKT
ncbi:MAG: DUF3857 domain-containing protein [Flavobacteriaceae bacterium]